MLGVFYVVLAAFSDIGANYFVKKSKAFTIKKYGFIAIALAITAFVFLAFALDHLNLGIAYAIWGGIGVLGTAIIGVFAFGEKLGIMSKIGIAFVIASVILLSV